MTSRQRPGPRADRLLRGAAAAFAGTLALLLGMAAIRSEAQLRAISVRDAVREDVARIGGRIAEEIARLYLQLGEATAQHGQDGLSLATAGASLAERPYPLWRFDGEQIELATPGAALPVAAGQITARLAAGDGPLLGPLRGNGGDLIILQGPAAGRGTGSPARLGWLIPLDDLWARSGLNDFVSSGMDVSVTDPDHAPLLKSSAAKLDHPVSASFTVLGDHWRIEAVPKGGWPTVASGAALFVVCLIGIGYGSAYFLLSKRPRELERQLAALRSQIDERDTEVATLLRSRAQLETRLMNSLTVDLRTGLPNRSRFVQHLQAKLAEARQTSPSGVFVAAVQFSKLEEFGHSMGVPVADGFLVEAADRLQRLMGPEILIARTGDKELALCICGADLPDPEAFTSQVFSVLEDRFTVGRQNIYSPALIGIAQCLDGYEHGPELVAQASLAATTAAISGNRWSVFMPEAKEERITLLQLEADLQSAIHNKELMLNFQPIVDLQNGNIVGFESLLRWWHPTESWVEPERFIPLAESMGLMSRISERVAAEGIAHAKGWQLLRPAPLYVTVNLTPRDLSRGFCNRIFDLLATNDLAPECLRVEITETALVQDFGLAARLIGELNDRGVRVLLDDFGTGYSSLSYLRDLPFHAVKIDKSFVQRMTSDARDFGLVRSIVSLVHYLGMECVAEGVESQEQLDLIGMINCDFWQGFLFSPPVAAIEVETLLTKSSTTVEPAEANR